MKQPLTKREREIYIKIVDFESPKEIAKDLSISIHTVRAHYKSIFVKLKVKTLRGLLAKHYKLQRPNIKKN